MLPAAPDCRTILVADDDEDSRIVFRAALGARGHSVLEAEDGGACLRIAQAARPDLIVLDLVMPVLDGLQTAARLRADPATASIPILMVTALARAEERDQARSAGCDDFLSKPVGLRLLLAQVEALLARAGPLPAPGT